MSSKKVSLSYDDVICIAEIIIHRVRGLVSKTHVRGFPEGISVSGDIFCENGFFFDCYMVDEKGKLTVDLYDQNDQSKKVIIKVDGDLLSFNEDEKRDYEKRIDDIFNLF